MRLAVFALAAVLGTAAAARAADLKVTITGAGPAGQVYARLFESKAAYEAGKAYAAVILTPTDGHVSVTFNDLPPGRYALAAFQDSKGTGKLETNLLGIPSVPAGFSNDATGTLGMPGFDRAAVTLGPDGAATAFQLR